VTYRISLSPSAARQLRKFYPQVRRRIQGVLELLAVDPRPPAATRLVGGAGEWRVRTGDYRIVYEIEDQELLVLVLKVGHRREGLVGEIVRSRWRGRPGRDAPLLHMACDVSARCVTHVTQRRGLRRDDEASLLSVFGWYIARGSAKGVLILDLSDRPGELTKATVVPAEAVGGTAGRLRGDGRRGGRLLAAWPQMTIRPVVLLAAFSLGGVLASSAAGSVAGPMVGTAPGRVVFSVDGGAIASTDDAGTGLAIVDRYPGGARNPGVALPDGDVVVSAGAGPGPAEIAELAPDGALDPSFGSGGIAQVTVDVPDFLVTQIVRQPDGKLVLLGGDTADDPPSTTSFVLVRLDADGSLDRSFGTAGVEVLPLVGSCASCVAVGVRPGGGLVVTGTPGLLEGVNRYITDWVVEGLTSTGALDPSFGKSGIATIAENGAVGMDLAVLPDGDIVTLGAGFFGGRHLTSYELARLLPSGAPDPAFDGGAAEPLPSPAQPVANLDQQGGMLAYPDGSVVVDLSNGIVRFTAAGVPDESFGAGGIAQTGPPGDPYQVTQLFPSPGDGAVVILENDAAHGRDRVERITAGGAIDPTLGGPTGLDFETPFGGGMSFVVRSPPVLTLLGPLAQNTFTGGSVVARLDGSYVFLGQVAVAYPGGEGTGSSIVDFAAAAVTPSFAPDTSFGGRSMPLHVTLAVIRQRAATAHARRGIRVTLSLSAPGLARIVFRAAGRVIAQSLWPVFHAGPTTLRAILTSFGYQWLRRDPHGAISASVQARDLLTNTATAIAAGRLR
jgi:mRNA interferase RelE/StbE